MNRKFFLAITITASAMALTAAFGQLAGPAPGTYDLSWNTVDGGGGSPGNGSSTGGAYEVSGTIGQADAGPTMTGGSFQLVGGFWPGAGPVNNCLPDIAPPGGNGIVNVDDLLMVINSWGPCSGCAADIVPPGGNGVVNVDDLLAVINAWGACP